MKLLFITDEYPPTVGGAGVVAQQFVRDFISTRSNSRIDVFCSSSLLKSKTFFKWFWPLVYLNIFIKFNIFEYDKIVVNDVRSAYFVGLVNFFTRKSFNKIVYILHGTESEVVYNPSIKNRLILLPFFYNRFLSFANSVVAVSYYTQRFFLQSSPAIVVENIERKIIVQYAGVSLSDFQYKSVIKSSKEIANSRPFRLVSVSRIERRKGYFEMLEIFTDLTLVNNEIEWYIYGGGTCFNELKEAIEEKGLQSKVFLMGAMTRESIFNDEFKKFNFDLFWLLPNKPEAFGLVFIEAALVGTPTIGVNKYGVSESVIHFYTSNDKLLKLIEEIKQDKSSFIDEAHFFAIDFSSIKFCDLISDL